MNFTRNLLMNVALVAVVTYLTESATPAADFDTCFAEGNGKIRGQFAIEDLDTPEPGDTFVVTAKATLANSGTPVNVVPAQILNGAAKQGDQPSILVATQAAEINRVAGFLDFDQAQGVTCVAGKINVDLAVQSYTQNGVVVPINGALIATGVAQATRQVAGAGLPTPAAAPKVCTVQPVQAAANSPAASAAAPAAVPAAPAAVPAVSSAAPAAPGAGAAGVVVTYGGQCTNGLTDHISLTVSITNGGEAFKPDAAGFGVPCDEYFELSWAFINAQSNVVANTAQQSAFFNAKRLVTDGAGNVVVQLSPEINGFGSGFLQLPAGISCANGQPNFKIRTNYLLTALNDGTYARTLNTVTDSGFFGSGQQSTVPANSNQFMIGQPQCNVQTNTFIDFPFPA